MTGPPHGFRSVVALGILALVCAVARANDIYVAQVATGSSTGQTCADAHDYTFFNTSGNWGSRANQIGPGTTVHLCGIFTAEPGSSGYLTFQGSGSGASPVTLRFESGALLQCAYWGLNGAIFSSGKSYVVVDGGANGVIQATDNGTSLGNQRDGKGVFLTMCDNCEVKNLSIANIYVHSSADDESGQNTYGVYVQYGMNATFANNSVHDAKWCLQYAYQGSTTSSNLRMFSNVTYRCDHGISVGSGNTGAILSGALLHDNMIHDSVGWDDVANNNHHDGIHVWAVHASSGITGLQVYNNRVYGDWGIHCTANIFLDAENDGTIDHFYVFNNDLGALNAAAHACGNGFISLMGANGYVLNNTIVSDSNASVSGLVNYALGQTVLNNVFYNVRTGIYSPLGTSLALSDYNAFYGLTNNAMSYRGTWYASFAEWQTATGFDIHSVTADPRLSSAQGPVTGSPLIGAGTDLSALGIGALRLDITGVVRTPPWAIGALAGTPTPPSGLTATPR